MLLAARYRVLADSHAFANAAYARLTLPWRVFKMYASSEEDREQWVGLLNWKVAQGKEAHVDKRGYEIVTTFDAPCSEQKS